MTYTKSAAKHGVAEADATWAMEHALVVRFRFQRSRISGLPDPTLFVGPDRAGHLLEVIAVQLGDDNVIFHAMRARKQFIDLIRPQPKGAQK